MVNVCSQVEVGQILKLQEEPICAPLTTPKDVASINVEVAACRRVQEAARSESINAN